MGTGARPVGRSAALRSAPAAHALQGESRFFEIMRVVVRQLSTKTAWRDLHRQLVASVDAMCAKIEESGPVPPRVRGEHEALKLGVRALAVDPATLLQVSAEQFTGVHPALE